MMDDVQVDCANCGVEFCLTQGLYRRRRNDGKEFYCPNGHSNVYRPTADQEKIADLEKQLLSRKRALDHLESLWEEMRISREELVGVLKECPFRCGYRSRRQIPRDPVAMGRGIERVQTDLREHLSVAHRATIEVQRLLPERTG
jgi:hypothetical protein